jgi:hypothetical protein
LAANYSISLVNVPFVSSINLSNASSNLTVDGQNRLQSIGACPVGLCLSVGTAQHAEAGFNANASWGRWKNGNATVNIAGFNFTSPLPGEQSIHYLIGVPATALPTIGTFTYTQTAATSPTVAGANAAAGTFTGALGVSFGVGSATKIGLNGSIAIAGGNYLFATSGGAANPNTSAITLDSNARFTADIRTQSNSSLGPLDCTGTVCTAQVNGGLFGPGGQTAGFSYRIGNNGSITINGVTVFIKP